MNERHVIEDEAAGAPRPLRWRHPRGLQPRHVRKGLRDRVDGLAGDNVVARVHWRDRHLNGR